MDISILDIIEIQVLEYADKRPTPITSPEISENLQIHQAQARVALNKLADHGLMNKVKLNGIMYSYEINRQLFTKLF